jgi:hypothetical protein
LSFFFWAIWAIFFGRFVGHIGCKPLLVGDLGDLAIWAILLEVTVKIAQIARFHFLYKKSHFSFFFYFHFFYKSN